MAPDYYIDKHEHLVKLCQTLDDFYNGKLLNGDKPYKKLMINIPPRMGKTRTLVNFCEWILGKNNSERIIACSYNDDVASDFSRYTRDGIDSQRNFDEDIIYSDIFPQTKIEHGNASFQKWALEGQFFNYIGAGVGSGITGRGGTCLPVGTKIKTEIGDINIEKLIKLKTLPLVLSYDHKSDKLVYRKIKASKEKWSNEFTRIKTTRGKTLTTTREHLIFCEQGYRQADFLRQGNRIKTCEVKKQQNLFNLWKDKRQGRSDVSGLLSDSKKKYDKINLFLLWQRLRTSKLFAGESFRKRLRRYLLLRKMQSESSRNKEQKKVCKLWQAITKAPHECKILFKGLQKSKQSPQIKTKKLYDLWKRISTYFKIHNVLQQRLCKQKTFKKNEGQREFKLSTWRTLYNFIQQNTLFNKKKRWQSLYDLWNRKQFACSSYRRKQEEQCIGKSYNSLQWLSYNISQVEEESISAVENISGKSIKVYDIEIEETNNFFANGILVHNCLIVDDILKGAEEALNENHLDKLWTWYTSTFLSRTSGQAGEALEIINMTRWSKKDLCGRILEGEYKDDWYVLSMEAYNEATGKMLCDDFLSHERYLNLRSQMVDMIFEANYHQKPIDLQGILYKQLKTYDKLPVTIKRVLNYTDTADTGKDWLCSIVFGEYNGEAYILDVLYTQEGMEITEPATAKFLYDNKVNLAQIESNNGGRGFARALQRLLWEKHQSKQTVIKWFTQTKNKEARIFSASAFVQEHIYFPLNWKDRWPEFYRDLTSYQKEGKNKFDDSADTISGIAEMISKIKSFEFV